MLLTTVASGVHAGKPHWHSNTSTIEADGIVVQIHENTPTYRFWVPGENKTAVYVVKFSRIVEFSDNDNDGRYNDAGDEILAQATLDSSDIWSVEVEEIQSSGVYEVRITISGLVGVTKMGQPEWMGDTANVTFVNHIYSDDYEVDGYPVKGGRELKIDIIISGWPWCSERSKLAIEIVLAGMFRGHNGVPKCSRDKMEYKNRQIHRIKMEGEDTKYSAEFRYQESARVKDTTDWECRVNATDNFRKDSARLWLSYPHFNDTLIHDPSILVSGVEEGGGLLEFLAKNAIYIGIIVAAIIILVIVIKRRHK